MKVDELRPASLAELKLLCREELAQTTWSDLPDPNEFAMALIEKGVVSMAVDGQGEVPIPSMVEWAKALSDPPSAPPTEQGAGRGGRD